MIEDSDTESLKKSTIAILVIVGLISGGIVSMFIKPSGVDRESAFTQPKKTKNIKMSAGIKDEKRFPDKAEGVLKEGGIDGEGNFHLVRPGGESQNVYLTSSTVDLSEFLGKKVRVWGETFKGEKAGWLMDVGYIEVIE